MAGRAALRFAGRRAATLLLAASALGCTRGVTVHVGSERVAAARETCARGAPLSLRTANGDVLTRDNVSVRSIRLEDGTKTTFDPPLSLADAVCARGVEGGTLYLVEHDRSALTTIGAAATIAGFAIIGGSLLASLITLPATRNGGARGVSAAETGFLAGGFATAASGIVVLTIGSARFHAGGRRSLGEAEIVEP